MGIIIRTFFKSLVSILLTCFSTGKDFLEPPEQQNRPINGKTKHFIFSKLTEYKNKNKIK